MPRLPDNPRLTIRVEYSALPCIYRNAGRARHLRQHMTEPERLLWQVLRRRQRRGCKFRRQAPVGPFIADFACFVPLLAVEVDGGTHDLTAPADARRDAVFRARGFTVLRFANEEVMRNLEAVAAAIDAALDDLMATG